VSDGGKRSGCKSHNLHNLTASPHIVLQSCLQVETLHQLCNSDKRTTSLRQILPTLLSSLDLVTSYIKWPSELSNIINFDYS
jgi:hypothetical protein